MKTADIMPLLEKGVPMLMGQYFHGRIETVNIRSKTDGRSRSANVVHETVLTDSGDAVAFSRFLKDEEKPEQWKPSAKRGQRVIVKITKYMVEQGSIKVSGVIETVE